MRRLITPLVLGCALGCDGSASPEQRLEEAGAALESARDETADARGELAEAKQTLAGAEAAVVAARRQLRAAEARLLSAEARLERRATDVALFRRIQAELLESDPLREDAVVVRVEDGVVTLEGRVRDDDGRNAALQLAGATPGVSQVRDQLEVEHVGGG